jgi:hypothetical protein
MVWGLRDCLPDCHALPLLACVGVFLCGFDVCLQDWRIYPHARFVSEYGWQSYPSWSTYAAATAEEDWSVTAAMTEFR